MTQNKDSSQKSFPFLKSMIFCGQNSHKIHKEIAEYIDTIEDGEVKKRISEYLNKLDRINDRQLQSISDFLDEIPS